MNSPARQNALYTGISGVMMLAYGWGMGLRGASKNSFYNLTVSLADYDMKFGGIALLIVTAILYAGLPIGLLLETITAGICGSILALAAAYWMFSGGSFSMTDLVFLIFGGLLVKDSLTAWQAYSAGQVPTVYRAQPAPPPPPVHPASIRPAVLPREDEPPPEEGYLAALAKEQEKPPTANYE